MRQAILLDTGDFEALRRGGGLHLDVAPGVTVTLLFLDGRAGRRVLRAEPSSNGHKPARRARTTGFDKNGRKWVFTKARRAALAKGLAAARKDPKIERRRLKALRAAIAKKTAERRQEVPNAR